MRSVLEQHRGPMYVHIGKWLWWASFTWKGVGYEVDPLCSAILRYYAPTCSSSPPLLPKTMSSWMVLLQICTMSSSNTSNFELKLHTLNLQSSFVLANVRSAPYCAKFAFYARSVQFPGPVSHWTSQFCTGFAAFPVLHWSTFVALTPWSWTWCSTGSAVQLLHPLLAGNIHWEWWWWWWRQWRWWWLWWLWWQWWWWWFSAL